MIWHCAGQGLLACLVGHSMQEYDNMELDVLYMHLGSGNRKGL